MLYIKIITSILILLNIQNSFAFDLEKDLKKVSKLNSFVDSKGKKYEMSEDIDKAKTLLIIYTHGDHGRLSKLETCKPEWNKIRKAIYQLDGSTINGLKVKTYQHCNGVRGWTKREDDIFWDTYWDSGEGLEASLKLVDKNGVLLIDKHDVILRQKVMKMKIDEFKQQGFNNIVLAGHSAGGWDSITVKSQFPSEIDGVIALSPARSGDYVKSLKKNDVSQSWKDNRDMKISWIKLDKLDNILVYSHDQDSFENPKSLSFLINLEQVNFVDLTESECLNKGEDGHFISETKCWNESEKTKKQIVKYLESLVF
tara:strand:- start:9231 stop:10166 length:936 start_codon:yes stop_codon:yes gene_type:complete